MDGEQVSDAANVEAGWGMRHDEASGQVYYWNSITGETSWEPPPHFTNVGNVVHPWTQTFDDEGRIYYLNTETMETRWTPPPDNAENDVLRVTGGRGRRPSTAEQMHELNRLLSGGGDDGEEEDSPEMDDVNASSSIIQEKTTAEAQACPWMMFINEDDGVPYYYNGTTNECLWEPPEEFLRFQQGKQLENIDETTISTTATDNSAITRVLDSADAKDEPVDLTTNNELADNAAMQVVITPEFEEKVRQAIAAVSNTPVSSSRLVLIHTPTLQQLAPRTGRSAGGMSARSTFNSARSRRDLSSRPSSASSRPSSGGAVSRSSRLDPIPTTTENSSAAEEEKITTNAIEDGSQIEGNEAPVDTLRVSNEQDDEEQIPHSILANSEEKTGIENAPNADNKEENNVTAVTSEVKKEDTVESETTLITTLNMSVENEADNHLEEAKDAGTGFEDFTNNKHTDADEIMKDEPTTGEVANDFLDTTSLEQNIQAAALIIQCMVRCFNSRQRVKHKREERKQLASIESPPVSDTIITATDPSSMIPEIDNKDTLRSLPAQEAEREEEPYRNGTDESSQPDDVQSNDEPPAMLPAAGDQDPPHISARSDVQSDVNGTETPPSSRSTLPSVQNSAATSTQKQHPRRDPASIYTRLPSVLDVTKYFPQRRSATSSRIVHFGGSTNINEHVAIIRKKVDMASPPRVRRASQQEMQVEHEQLLDKRKKEDERAQYAQVIEYQRIYAESRKKFEAEKQRLLAEKVARDNHCDHDAEEEKRARIKAQRERDVARARYKTVDDKADRLVWEYMKTRGRPTEQNVNRFRDALTQALDSAQFPDKMCAERARELNERIKRLHRSSWAVGSQLEDVELRLISELHPLTARQRPLQAKYAARLRCRLEKMLNTVQSWQYVIDERESEKENGSTNKCWSAIQARYVPSSTISSSDESRRQYVLNEWRGAAGGDSLLHVAAWNGWEEHVRLLIEEGSDVNLVDCSASHRTPLHEACRAGHAPVVEQLLRSGARLNAVDISGDSPLHVACRGGWTRVVRILLMAANDLGEERDPDDQTPLTLEDFFNLRNGKGKRAIEVVTLPSLVEELQNYDYQLNGDIQHSGVKQKKW